MCLKSIAWENNTPCSPESLFCQPKQWHRNIISFRARKDGVYRSVRSFKFLPVDNLTVSQLMNQIDADDRSTSRIPTRYAPCPGLIDMFSLQTNASGITKSQSSRMIPSASNEGITDSFCSTLSIKWDEFCHPLGNAVRSRISLSISSLNVAMNALDTFLGFWTYWEDIHSECSTRRWREKRWIFDTCSIEVLPRQTNNDSMSPI